MKDTEKIVFGGIYGNEKSRQAQLPEDFEETRPVYREEMKTIVLAIIGLSVLGYVWAQDTSGKASESRDAFFAARSVRAKLFPFRGFCGRYGDPCGILIPCCEREGFDCDYSGGFNIGKCLKDWKKK